MKTIRYFLAVCLFLGVYMVHAQSKTTTVIILRHAEKDTSRAGSQNMQADPPLSTQGQSRAESLVAALQDFTPAAIYSTQYNRTRSTVAPLAKKLGLEVQAYDPRNQQALADKIKTMEGQTIVVVGHSNTAPRLVNLLAATDKYKDLEDSVYDQIYIVRITGGVATVETRKY